MTFIQRANAVEVTPELLEQVLVMHASLPPAERTNFQVRTIRTVQMLDEHGLRERHRDLPLAIEYRLGALAQILKDNEVHGWVLPSSEAGAELIHPSLVRAAAEEPLLEGAGERAVFDPTSFRQRALELTTAESRA